MKTQNKLVQKSTGLAIAMPIVLACLAAQGGELEITSIVPSTNGIKVVWTNSLPGHAFTLQTLDSLSAGSWNNAPTRYRWPGLMNHWVEPGTPRGSARLYRVMAEPAYLMRASKKPSTRRQETPEALLAQLLDFLQRKFYQGHPVEFAKDRRRLLDWVVLWPAKWLNERAVTIPPDRYREIFYRVFHDALSFGTIIRQMLNEICSYGYAKQSRCRHEWPDARPGFLLPPLVNSSTGVGRQRETPERGC